MPSVAFLSLTHPFDDTRILHKEARSLADAGLEVSHIAPDKGKVAPPEVHGIRIIQYPFTAGVAGRLRRLRTLWRLARASNADVLHANEVESWVVALLVKLGRPRVRVVFDVHEHYPSRFSEPRFPRWLRWLGEPAIRLLFRLGTPFTDLVVFAKRSVAPDFRVRPGQGVFVFNYAPMALAVPAREEVSPAIRSACGPGPLAVHLGGLSRARGWPQLLQALARMQHTGLRVLALGEIEDDPAAFQRQAAELGVADRVMLRARVPYGELFQYLACADVGLMLYQPGILNHVYAFPMKLYDYMRAGLASIGPAFAVEVTPVIEEVRCGWLIDTSNPTELAAALDEACANPEETREAGRRARRAAGETYNWERQAAVLVEAYRALLGERWAMDSRSTAPGS